jgi:hypothetical protein
MLTLSSVLDASAGVAFGHPLRTGAPQRARAPARVFLTAQGNTRSCRSAFASPLRFLFLTEGTARRDRCVEATYEIARQDKG